MRRSARFLAALWLLGALSGCGGEDNGTAATGSGGGVASGSGGAAASGSGGGSAGGGGEPHDGVRADAGPDQSVKAPADSATLMGSGSATSGAVKFLWTQTGGPTASIAHPTAASTAVAGLLTGTYTFRLTVTDAHGHAAHDTAAVTVDPHHTFVVSTHGDDATGDGSVAKPWLTLGKAAASVATAGDLIHILAGTYTESRPANVAVGVSIVGDGASSTRLVYHYYDKNVYGGAILLSSATEGTNGNQSISELSIDGDAFYAFGGIKVRGRSNVKIHDLDATSFQGFAVSCEGRVGTWGTEPGAYATRNEIYGSTFTDCNTRVEAGGLGSIQLGGQEGILIHDNVFHQTGRPVGNNGDILGAVEGHNRGMKYYNNTSYKPVDDGPYDNPQQGNLHIESWNAGGGMEIYGNQFHGGGQAIDVGGTLNVVGAYDYSWYIHDNLFDTGGQLPAFNGDQSPMAVDFEAPVTKAEVARNVISGYTLGIEIYNHNNANTPTAVIGELKIHHNLFKNMGYANGATASHVISISAIAAGAVNDGIAIENNTIASGDGKIGHDIRTTATNGGTLRNLTFANNIVENVGPYGYLSFEGTSTIEDVHSDHNILWQNGNDNKPYYKDGQTVTGFVESANLFQDPRLDSKFVPRPGSPALGAGRDVGLPFSGAAPNIGAY